MDFYLTTSASPFPCFQITLILHANINHADESYIYHLYTRSEGHQALPSGNIIISGDISPNPPTGGYIDALLCQENIWILKKRKVGCHFNLQNKQFKSPPFWRTGPRLSRVVIHPIFTPYSPIKTIFHGHIPHCVHIPCIPGWFSFKSHAHVV